MQEKGQRGTNRTPNLKLRSERELKGWSQADVAEKIGAQTNLVTRWETGATSPSPYYRQKLCELFEKNAKELGLIKDVTTDTTIEGNSPQTAPPYTIGSATVTPITPLTLKPHHQASISRRTIAISLAGGAVAGIAGIFWWGFAHTPTPPSASTLPRTPSISTVYIYDTHPPTGVNDVAWSPTGTWIACALGDKTAQVVAATNGRLMTTYRGHTGNVNAVAWSPDQLRVASASADKTVHVWDALTGMLLFHYKHKETVLGVAWSPDGTRIASSGEDSLVQIWDAHNGAPILTYNKHTQQVWSIAWSPDSGSIASASDDGTIRVWNAKTGEDSPTFRYRGPTKAVVNAVAWSPDGNHIASAHSDTSAYIWDALTGSRVLTYSGHSNAVQDIKWSPNGKQLASAGYDTTVQVWDALTGEHPLIYRKHAKVVFALSWSPDSKRLATASNDETMHVCQVTEPS